MALYILASLSTIYIYLRSAPYIFIYECNSAGQKLELCQIGRYWVLQS